MATKKAQTSKPGKDKLPEVINEEPKPEEVKTVVEPIAPEPEPIIPIPEQKTEPVVVPEPGIAKNIITPAYQFTGSPSKEDASDEEKILNFLDGKSGTVNMNGFLKSLAGVPKMNEPPRWMQQGYSKYLRSLLSKMQTEGKITISNNRHLQLGQFYYEGEQHLQKHYNLNHIQIECKN